MKLYLGVKLANYYNAATPLQDWFDDAGWSEQGAAEDAATWRRRRSCSASPESPSTRSSTLSRAARRPPPGSGTTRATPTRRRRCARRPASAAPRLMGAILDRLPGRRVRGLSRLLSRRLARADPRGGQRRHQHVGRSPRHRLLERDDERRGLRRDPLLRLGLLQGPAHGQLGQRPHLQPQPGPRHLLAALLQLGLRLRSRVHVSPFGWIDDGPTSSALRRRPSARATSPSSCSPFASGAWAASSQTTPTRRWTSFDYSPYVTAMQAASRPGNVDGVDPTLELTESRRARRSRAPLTTTSRSGPCAGRTIAVDRASPG